MEPSSTSHRVLTVRDKSVPAELWGRTVGQVAEERPALSTFSTPLLTFDRTAAAHNVDLLARWAAERGLELAPHGKTTMSPELWSSLLDAGATALTLATPWQVQVAVDAGVRSILLADELIDPPAVRWIVTQLETQPDLEFRCFLDSARGLRVLADTEGDRPVEVLIELSGPGGRAGVRDVDSALALAWAASREPRVRLVGVAVWEGALAGDRTPDDAIRVRALLDDLVELHESIAGFGLFEVERPIVSAGGSMWFDLVAEVTEPLAERTRRVLRSGAFQAHDDVHYAEGSPFVDSPPDERFRPALAAWARVLSRPERTLAILDAGRRDVPYDLDLPVPLTPEGAPLPRSRLTRIDDQHAYLRVPAESSLRVGDLVRLGLSHPCTAFDKWRLIPTIEGDTWDDAVVTGFIETVF